MANTEVGSAYVTVYPQTDGNFSKQVGAKIGDGVGKGLSARSVALGNLVSTGLIKAASAAAEGIGSIIGGAMTNYANYEQLVGGVETLFKDSAGMVEQYARNAYQTAGLSANEYMETVTSFSASLLQSLGGDTAAAAKYADTAISDMSDNANKMGSDMASIQNAYQGFAKQNYTMLDNLKLGYGGTKEEMERLLKDAGELAGVEFNIDNYSDVIEAIHVMQTSMDISGYSVDELKQKLSDMSLTTDELQKVADDLGISYDEAMSRMQDGTLSVQDAQALLGTTAREAATTIQGSVNAMKGAWDNWLTSLATNDLDMTETTEALLSSIETVAQNVLPRLGMVVTSIVQAMPELGSRIAAAIPELGGTIADAFGDMMSGAFGVDIDMRGFKDSLADALSGLDFSGVVESVDGAVGSIVATFADMAPTVEDIISNVGTIIAGIAPVVSDIATKVGQVVSTIVSTVLPVIDAVTSVIAENMPLIQTVVGTAMDFTQNHIMTVMAAVQAVFETVWPVVTTIVDVAASAIAGTIDGLSSIVGTVTSTFNSVKDAIAKPIETAKGIIQDAITAIQNIVNGAHLQLPHFALPHFRIYGGELPWGIGGKGTPPSVNVDWYASGAVFTKPTVLAGVGEGGEPEGVFPLSWLEDKLGDRGGGDTYNLYLDGVRVNDDAQIQAAVMNLFGTMKRKAVMLNG